MSRHATQPSPALPSEKALVGALLQEHDAVYSLCQRFGIAAASFTDAVCGRSWAAMEKLRAGRKVVSLVSVPEAMDGDAGENMAALGELVGLCPTTAHAEHYARQVADAQRRRGLAEVLASAQERLARGDASDDIGRDVGAVLEAAGEQSAGGPLVATFPPIRYGELLRLEVKPEENHILGKGFLRRGAWSLFTGGTGTGKSVLGEQVSACVACGRSIFGLAVARPFKAILLTAEQDVETLKRDLEAIAEYEGLDAATLDANLQIHHAYALDGPPLAAALESELRRGCFDLLVLDNYQAFSGATDLNDSAAWNLFITPLSMLLTKYRAAMLLVDHTGKPRERQNYGRHDSVYLAAGTSRKANGARASMELYSPAEGDERYRLHFGKNPERAGIVDANGRLVRDVYLDRSPDATKPYWTPSADQTDHKPMVEGEQEIVTYATAHPFDGVRKIEAATGYSKSKVARILAKYPLLSHGREEKP